MNGEMAAKIFGCSAFGMGDVISNCNGEIVDHTDATPSTVVLPVHPYGPILAGDRANKSRVSCGMPWPPEARINPGGYIRRVPIFCAWRNFVEARDSQTRWGVGNGISFTLPAILAAHILDLLLPQARKNRISATLTIPNNLDEYGQEDLLNELKNELASNSISGDIQLLWRPVAAALTWLQEAGGDMIIPTVRNNPDDFFIVLYLGTDAIECVSFRLRLIQDDEGLFHVVPRRDRSQSIPPLCGYDWVGNIIELLPTVRNRGENTFWQAFISFPDIWEIAAGKRPSSGKFPRILGTKDGYDFWKPDEKTVEYLFKSVVCGSSNKIKRILKSSCDLDGSKDYESTWPERLTKLVEEIVREHSSGRMVGMVLCGPLAPPDPPTWLSSCFPLFQDRGLDTEGPWNRREANRLWISSGNDCLAKGAALFHKRLLNGEPTYLDTLPKYFLVIKEKLGYTTKPLVDAPDVEGGKEYTNQIQGLGIEGGSKKLDIVIARHGRHQELLQAKNGIEHIDNEVSYAPRGISLAEASLLRHLVREAKDLKSAFYLVKKNAYIMKDPETAIQYGRTYSALWHGAEDEITSSKTSNGVTKQKIQDGPKRTPFRLLQFPFPSPAPRTMRVGLDVTIRPASGMASLEIRPEDNTFLHGRRIFVDYRLMRTCQPEELVAENKGWPPLEERTPHPDPKIWVQISNVVSKIEIVGPMTDSYSMYIKQIYDFLRKSPRYTFAGGMSSSLPILSQDGLAGCPAGDEIISRFLNSLQDRALAFELWGPNQTQPIDYENNLAFWSHTRISEGIYSRFAP